MNSLYHSRLKRGQTLHGISIWRQIDDGGEFELSALKEGVQLIFDSKHGLLMLSHPDTMTNKLFLSSARPTKEVDDKLMIGTIDFNEFLALMQFMAGTVGLNIKLERLPPDITWVVKLVSE